VPAALARYSVIELAPTLATKMRPATLPDPMAMPSGDESPVAMPEMVHVGAVLDWRAGIPGQRRSGGLRSVR
jgi:hypothetical protein